MTQKLVRLLDHLVRAHAQLTKALAQPKDEFMRDAAIQRFEFSFELFWKTLQAYCRYQGIEATSPRASIREAFRLGVIDDDGRYMAMLQSRNLTAHTYEEAVAETIYAALPAYADAMQTTVARMQAELAREEASGT